MKRKLAPLAAVAVASLLLVACADTGDTGNGTDEGTSQSQSPDGGEEETLRIAFIPGIASDPFFKAMEKAAKETATELNIELTWQGAADEYSPESQIPFVDAALADDIDGMVLVPTDADALLPAVNRAAEMGIPVVTVDTTVSDQSTLVSHITGDNKDGGMKAAEEMAEQTGGSGTVLIISASPTNTTGTQRVEGFLEKAEADFAGLDILPTQYAYSQPSEATTILNTTLLEYPDLAGVFAVDGTSCTGAVASIAALSGEAPKLICYDAYSTQVTDLENGTVSALIAQDPAQEARLALEYLAASLRGDDEASIEKSVVIPNVIMNLANLDETRQYEYAE